MLFNSVFVNVDVTCFFKGPAIQVFQVLGAAYEMPFCPRLFCFFFFCGGWPNLGGEALVAVVFWPAGLDASFIYRGLKFFFLWPFPGCRGGGGVACGLCSGSRAVCPGASPSEVYPAGKLP